MKRNVLTYSFFILTTMISSCMVTRTFHEPDVRTQALFRDTPETDSSSMANLKWTYVFTDSLLQQLIHEGIANNLDLKIAYSRIQQARAYSEQSKLAFLPAINGNVLSQEG